WGGGRRRRDRGRGRTGARLRRRARRRAGEEQERDGDGGYGEASPGLAARAEHDGEQAARPPGPRLRDHYHLPPRPLPTICVARRPRRCAFVEDSRLILPYRRRRRQAMAVGRVVSQATAQEREARSGEGSNCGPEQRKG